MSTNPIPVNPTLPGTAIFLQTVGVGGLISGIETGMLGGNVDIALHVMHGALAASGYASGQTPAARLAAILGGYGYMEGPAKGVALPQICKLLREAEMEAQAAIAALDPEEELRDGAQGVSVGDEEEVIEVPLVEGDEPHAAVVAAERPGFPTIEELDSHIVQLSEKHPIVVADRAFASTLFARFAEIAGPTGNLFFSPHSISSALRMLMVGAEGETHDAIGQVLGLSSMDDRDVNFASRALAHALSVPDSGVILNVGNAMAVSPAATVNADYLRVIRKVFDGQTFDLSSDGIARLNAWIGDKTDGRIEAGIDPSSINPLDMLILAGVIYFHGEWTNRFEASDTRPESFFTGDGGTVHVPMMHQRGEFRADYMDESGTAVELPYGDGTYSMVIFLPGNPRARRGQEKEPMTLARFNAVFGTNDSDYDLLSVLSPLNLKRPREIDLAMPKFRTRFRAEISEILRDMGMAAAFDGSMADFSRMLVNPSPSSQGGTGHVLSRANHQAVIDVDERGTIAAAMTDFGVPTLGITPEIKLDHPFAYAIVHRALGLPIFMGWMNDPTK